MVRLVQSFSTICQRGGSYPKVPFQSGFHHNWNHFRFAAVTVEYSQNPSSNPIGMSHRSHTWVGWGWPSRFRPFANVVTHSSRCRFWVIPVHGTQFFQWITTFRRKANWFQAFSTVASADQNCSSGAAPYVRNGQKRLGQPRPVAIHRQIRPATSGTAPVAVYGEHQTQEFNRHRNVKDRQTQKCYHLFE